MSIEMQFSWKKIAQARERSISYCSKVYGKRKIIF